MRGFDWNDLQAFLAVARAGRLTVAAREAGVDHSTLSRRIAALEVALGARLFDRRPGGFALTAEGERLLADAESMESLALRMRSRLEEGAKGLSGSVRAGTPEGFGTYFLAPRLPRLQAAHPQLEIELVANPRSFSLSKREADLAVTMAKPSQGRVYASPLVDYSLGVFASRAYLGAHRRIRARSDLAKHRWVGYVDELMWTPELDYLPQVAPAVSPHARISNVITQAAAVAGGAGLAVLPHFIARTMPALVPVLRGAVRLERSYWLVTHADTRDLARVSYLEEFIREESARAGPAFWMD